MLVNNFSFQRMQFIVEGKALKVNFSYQQKDAVLEHKDGILQQSVSY